MSTTISSQQQATTNSTGSLARPSLPTLYFFERETSPTKECTGVTPACCQLAPEPTTNSRIIVDNDESSPSTLTELPSELLHKCLTDYADWGDLAKLSCVQSSWQTMVDDAANHGGSDAKWDLAQALMNGTRGLERNAPRAIRYLTDLAGGDEEVLAAVAVEDEKSDEANDENSTGEEEADEPMEIAAAEDEPIEAKDEEEHEGKDAHFAPAMRMLATCHLTGDGVSKSNAMGIAWLKCAAKTAGASNVDAAHDLAVLYESGSHDEPVDVVAAAEWFLYAAERGHVEAMAEYGLCCELGCGVEQDDEEALRWYMRAANAGHAVANYSVGEAFEEARGVPQSDEEACLWYYKAAEIDRDEESMKALRRLHDIARIVLPGGWQQSILLNV